MKGFETGMHYLRKVALEKGMIAESDNDGVLVERLAKLITHKCPEVVAPEVIEEAPEVEEAPLSAEDGEGVEVPPVIAKPTFM
ncbi:MAG: hypothetical protein K940chlam2_01598 [Chlamydiae bacterium]|nr:hypothetical protein [Chlamydiota bacterium]